MATTLLLFECDVLRPRWGWLLFLGIFMVILGTVALFMMPAATLGTILVLGWLLVLSGIIEMIHASRVRRWGGLFLHLIGGVLGVLIGLLVVTHPVAGALAWTLLFASFFTAIGLFRLIAAISLKFPNWGWAVFDGIVTLGLGILLWTEWPWSGVWFLGLAVGVSLILRGWSYVMFALAIRNLAIPIEIRRAA
ncbi:MAG: HdeD family acid-resistance protein [Candidatus Sulfotelmatobacter sp.]